MLEDFRALQRKMATDPVLVTPPEVFNDTPRAIPAADPFAALPEPAWIGRAMAEKRDEMRASGVEEVALEATLQTWAIESLPVEDHRHEPVELEPLPGEAWRLQPRDHDTGQFMAKDD